MKVDSDRIQELAGRAAEVAQRAYVPASGFRVGAALLADDGRIFVGCNVENASYGLSVCAERNAAFHAVAEGATRFVAAAVWTDVEEPGSPCGACRQVLTEFAGPDCVVAMAGRSGKVIATTLGELLPRPFTMETNQEERPK